MNIDWQTVLTVIPNMVTMVAAATAAVVAVLGLRTWRAQLHGQADYDLAKRLLRAAFRVRDEIGNVRNPFMSGGEIEAAFKRADTTPDLKAGFFDERSNRLVYRMRWALLAEALSTFQVELLEAEVVWGSAVKQAAGHLFQCVTDLHIAIDWHLRAEKDLQSKAT